MRSKEWRRKFRNVLVNPVSAGVYLAAIYWLMTTVATPKNDFHLLSFTLVFQILSLSLFCACVKLFHAPSSYGSGGGLMGGLAIAIALAGTSVSVLFFWMMARLFDHVESMTFGAALAIGGVIFTSLLMVWEGFKPPEDDQRKPSTTRLTFRSF